ncbi:MAG: glycosyltransferase family 2 protein [Planctomycetales bacterium]
MYILTLILVILLALLLFGQGIAVVGLVAALRGWKRKRLEDHECPKTAVILCLRGLDPFLNQVIEALLEQDYPSYQVRIMVDSQQDPAWELVHELIAADSKDVHVEALRQPRSSCSLKCSSLIQAVSALDDSYEVVAQLDADTIPHKTWLRELVAPLAKDDVAAVTGNRWYMPSQPTSGAMLRYLWNACAIIQMFWYRIAWGGTLAMKTSVIRKCGLIGKWGNAFCEDTMLYEIFRKEGMRVEFVPSLMMVNRESCDVKGLFHWISRQLLTARLYHPKFGSVAAHGVFITVVSAATIAVVVAAAIQQNLLLMFGVAGAWIVYELILTLYIFPMEKAVRNIVASRGQPIHWVSGTTVAVGLYCVLALQIIYPLALLKAMFARKVELRGLPYEIDRRGDIKMLEYRQYQPSQASDTNTSL